MNHSSRALTRHNHPVAQRMARQSTSASAPAARSITAPLDLNSLISLIDAIENFRDLYAMEKSFRVAMKKHLATLLQQ
jgi:hypothetical protein